MHRTPAATADIITRERKIMAGTSNLPFSEHFEAPVGSGAIGPEERWFSAAAGACLVGYGLSKVSLRSLAAMAIGGYLVYRGSTGRCPISDKLGCSNGVGSQDGCGSGGSQNDDFERDYASRDAGIDDRDSDPVDEAAMESFPASDPPSYSSGTSTPSQPIH
jgi:hypothetical protein